MLVLVVGVGVEVLGRFVGELYSVSGELGHPTAGAGVFQVSLLCCLTGGARD